MPEHVELFFKTYVSVVSFYVRLSVDILIVPFGIRTRGVNLHETVNDAPETGSYLNYSTFA